MDSQLCNPTTWTDEEIVTRILSGEEQHFEILVRRHSARLHRIAVSVLRDSMEAEDVVQDTYLSAYRHLRQFEGRSKFSTWLSRIAVRFAWLRSAQRARQVSVEPEDAVFQNLAAHSAGPEQTVTAREEATRVALAMKSLPEKYRAVLVVRELHDSDTAATAQHLRISESNVKVRLHRARALLRKELRKPAQAVWASTRQTILALQPAAAGE